MYILRYHRIRFALLALPAWLLSCLFARNPQLCEQFFSSGFQRFLRDLFGRFFGLFPFSISEFFIVFAIATAIIYLTLIVRKFLLDSEHRSDTLLRFVSTLFGISGTIYFAFMVFCGYNYQRLTFSEHSGLITRLSSVEELAGLCTELSQRANKIRVLLPEDEGGVMASAFSSHYQTAVYASTAYQNLSDIYPVVGGYTPRAKPVLLSRGMSYLDITGVYFPFTFEGNINVDIVPYNIPATITHELAHFKGFMREDEANFIAYLACIHSGNNEYLYSGLMLALIHSTNALYSADRELCQQIQDIWIPGVKADISANNAYWRRFDTPVATVSTAVNNAYLKANRQEDGVKSYGHMVDLLLADYRQRHNID